MIHTVPVRIFFTIILFLITMHGATVLWGIFVPWNGRQEHLLMGTVVSLPAWQKHHLQWDFETPLGLLRTRCYGHCPFLKTGERWQLLLKVTSRNAVHEFPGFDYSRYLLARGYVGTAYLKPSADNHSIGFNFWAAPLTVIRDNLRYWINRRCQHLNFRNLILALSLGDRSGITQFDWQVFQKTGTSHLVAISGLHIGLAAAMAYFIMRWFWSLFYRLSLWLPAPRAASLFALLVAFCYSGLAGFAVSTQRALIMLLCLMLGRWFYFVLNPYFALILAAILVLLWNPFTIFMLGSWLSFLAVFFLIYAYQQYQPQFWLARILYPQCVVFIGLMSLTVYGFGQFSLVSLLANMLAIPFVSFVVVPTLLLALVCLPLHFISSHLYELVNWQLAALWFSLSWLAHWHDSHIVLGERSFWAVPAGLIGAIILLKRTYKYKRWYGLLWFLPLFV